MPLPQIIALSVLIVVIATLIWGKLRADIVALAGAAALLGTKTLRPVEVEGAFASPAIITLASLFVITYAMELSGLLGAIIRATTKLCAKLGEIGLWLLIAVAGGGSAFLNNTPIVVLAAPVVRDVAESMRLSPKRFLIPLSYVTILGGTCTLIGTSTNLLVNDMARNAGQPAFSMFEITPVALIVAVVGGLYLFLMGESLLSSSRQETAPMRPVDRSDPGDFASVYPLDRSFRPFEAFTSLAVFLMVVVVAATGLAPIAASAFTGAVVLVLLRVLTIEEAYTGLKPEVLFLIAGMVVIGISLEVTGLAATATNSLLGLVQSIGPIGALAILYGITLFLTEILSNAAVAVLLTPIAVALAESLGVSPRPFLIGIMMAASAAFATPFGYQTNVLVYKLGNYNYIDFVRIGVPLNLLTWAVGVATIPLFFPF